MSAETDRYALRSVFSLIEKLYGEIARLQIQREVDHAVLGATLKVLTGCDADFKSSIEAFLKSMEARFVARMSESDNILDKVFLEEVRRFFNADVAPASQRFADMQHDAASLKPEALRERSPAAKRQARYRARKANGATPREAS